MGSQVQRHGICTYRGSAARFKYQGIDQQLPCRCLRQSYSEQLKTLKKELLEKLNISECQWPKISTCQRGREQMRSRDMMKWGLLVHQQGKFNGEQLIPADYIEQATSALCAPSETNSYGFFFWRHVIEVGETQIECVTCRGAGGQFIFLFPKLDIITVITSHNKGMGTLLKTLPIRVLPSFRHDQKVAF